MSARLARVHAISRIAVAGVFFWHGLVPKLIFRHPDEAVMLTDAGFSQELADLGVLAAGVAEIGIAVLLLVFWRSRFLLWGIAAAMVLAVVLVAWHSPRFFTAAFNPLTLNGCVVALAAIALLTSGPPALEARPGHSAEG